MKTCSACGQNISAKLLAKKKRIKGERIRNSFKLAVERGDPVGRPRKPYWSKALSMHKAGCSNSMIAGQLGTSISAIAYVIKKGIVK